MESKKFFLIFSFLCASVVVWAKEVTDTLESSERDKIFVTYNITQNDGHIVLKFIRANKILSRTHRNYRPDKVKVLFFDRHARFGNSTEFEGINVEVMKLSNIKYKDSEDGYFILDDNPPPLSFDLKSTEPSELSIPLYLAYYEKKRHYKVLSKCKNLVIKLGGKHPGSNDVQLTSQTITSIEEIEEGLSVDEEANCYINVIEELLPQQDKLPFTEELKQKIGDLRVLKHNKKTSKNVVAKISEILAACKDKEKELEKKIESENQKKQEALEFQAQMAAKQEQARRDSIEAAAQAQAEKDKKRNMWMIIGGGILAILAFVSNQVFQHIRNVKNQKSITEIQQEMVKRAEDEAKRRAQNAIRTKTNQVQNEVRRKSRDAVHNGIGKIVKGKGKNNKEISI